MSISFIGYTKNVMNYISPYAVNTFRFLIHKSLSRELCPFSQSKSFELSEL